MSISCSNKPIHEQVDSSKKQKKKEYKQKVIPWLFDVKQKMKLKDSWRFILFPLAALYGLAILFRNGLYSAGVLKEARFQIPIITVGNLSVGGTGKTPHIEYLIMLLKDYVDVATLSRGYKRKTTGFRMVQKHNRVDDVGDEPLLLGLKYDQANVFVGEDRVLSVPMILKQYPETELILLDDAFQHRPIRAGLNILLTPYHDLYADDYLLPMGRLREFRSGSERADIIIVTKCPQGLDAQSQRAIAERLRSESPEEVFFSTIIYDPIYSPFGYTIPEAKEEFDVILLSGIASNKLLLEHVREQFNHVRSFDFPDHHKFTKNEIAKLAERYEKMDSNKKIILTTEKDLMRLLDHRDYILENRLPIFVLPIRIGFLEKSEPFDDFIKNFLLSFKA